MPRKGPMPKASRPIRAKQIVARAKDAVVPMAAATRAIEPDARPIVQVLPGTGGLNLRAAPGGALIMTLSDGTFLSARESAEAVGAKMGVPNQWLAVSTLAGKAGFVAAQWLKIISTQPTSPPTPPSPVPAPSNILADAIAQNTVFASAYVQWGQTPCSSGAPTASHQARAAGTPDIFPSLGSASSGRNAPSSNVRQHDNLHLP